ARARSLYAECLAIFQELGDQTGVAWSMNYQGDVARDQGDSAAARTLYEQGLAIFRELGDRWGIAGTLADLGSLAREEANYPTARSLYRESIKIFQELDHKRGIARLLECFACSAAVQLEAERSLRLSTRNTPVDGQFRVCDPAPGKSLCFPGTGSALWDNSPLLSPGSRDQRACRQCPSGHRVPEKLLSPVHTVSVRLRNHPDREQHPPG